MLGIIINPKSGKKAFRAQRLYLWKLIKARREPFIYRVTKYENHAIELGRELVEEKGCTEILVLGGDGTISEVINGIMRADLTSEQRAQIKFGIMPRGTGNDFARHWGLTKDFKRSLEVFFAEEIQEGDTLRLEKVADPEKKRRLMQLFRETHPTAEERETPKEPEPEDEQAVEDTAYFQMRQRITELLSTLSEADAKLLTLRFGLEGGLPLSAEDTGKRLGLTPNEVVAVESAAMVKMRNK